VFCPGTVFPFLVTDANVVAVTCPLLVRSDELSRRPAGRLKLTLRQVHTAGEHLFVAFVGSTIAMMEGLRGE
jgi:hypothetical protein